MHPCVDRSGSRGPSVWQRGLWAACAVAAGLLGLVGLVLPLLPGIPLLLFAAWAAQRACRGTGVAGPERGRAAGLHGLDRLRLAFWLGARRLLARFDPDRHVAPVPGRAAPRDRRGGG